MSNVNIDGTDYAANSTYNTVGDHTMTYSLFGNEYTCDFIVYYAGDANGDGGIDILDMIAIAKMQSVPGNSATRTNAARLGADINSDGTYDADDLVLLKKILLRISDIILISPAFQ